MPLRENLAALAMVFLGRIPITSLIWNIGEVAVLSGALLIKATVVCLLGGLGPYLDIFKAPDSPCHELNSSDNSTSMRI
jgi:hypothetical protein